MSKFNGSLLKAKVTGPPEKEIRNTRDISLNLTRDLINTSDRDDGGWTTRLPGRRDWNVKLTGVVDFAPGAGKTTIADLIQHEINGDLLDILFSTSRTSDVAFSGKCYISNIGLTFSDEGEALWTCDGSASGAITVAAIV